MTSSLHPFDQPVDDLLSKLLDDELDKGELCHLADQLRCNSQARQLYYDHIALHAILRWMDGGPQQEGLARAPSVQHPTFGVQYSNPSSAILAPPSPPRPGFLSAPLHTTLGYFPEDMPLAYLIATVVTGLGILIASHVYMSCPEQVARQSGSLPSPLSTLHSVVGRITGMVDCKWEKEGMRGEGRAAEAGNPTSYILNPKSFVALGDKFVLASGLMEITYDTGAKVILQGPVMYSVEANGGYLSVGKLTGKLEKKVASGQWPVASNSETSSPQPLAPSPCSNPQSLIPNPFVVRTPAATVTDLGTEFGVEVDQRGRTETQVFVGEVKIATSGNQEVRWEKRG